MSADQNSHKLASIAHKPSGSNSPNNYSMHIFGTYFRSRSSRMLYYTPNKQKEMSCREEYRYFHHCSCSYNNPHWHNCRPNMKNWSQSRLAYKRNPNPLSHKTSRRHSGCTHPCYYCSHIDSIWHLDMVCIMR